MKLSQFLLFITFCLVAVKAFEDLNNITLGRFSLWDPFDGPVVLDTCIYNQGRNRVYCSFENSKYTKKGLYVMIPITKVENGPFNEAEMLSFIDVKECDGDDCESSSRVATTTIWEIIEEGDSYKAKNRKFDVFVYTPTYHKDVYLHYDIVYVNKL